MDEQAWYMLKAPSGYVVLLLIMLDFPETDSMH